MEANGLQELRKFKLATLSDLSWDGRILGLSGPRWRFCRFDGDIKAAVAFFAPKKVNDRRVTYFGEQGEMLQDAARQADMILTARFWYFD